MYNCDTILTETNLGATHRGTHKIIPRHADEMKIEIGDSIHVINEADDGWCMGECYCPDIFCRVYFIVSMITIHKLFKGSFFKFFWSPMRRFFILSGYGLQGECFNE